MRKTGTLLICATALSLVSAPVLALDTSDMFDKPLDERQIPLAPDPVNPQAKAMLSCYYYRDFVIKQIDRGEVGAELSMITYAGAEAKPECREQAASNEKTVEDWGGYFKGVKGKYAFFDAADGQNGGVGLAVVIPAEGKKIFDDTVTNLHSINVTPSGLVMRYTRVYSAQCSLVSEPASCWSKINQELNLGTTPPDCSATYKAEQIRSNMKAEELAPDPSVLDYEAETTIDGSQAKITRVGGELTCRPAN